MRRSLLLSTAIVVALLVGVSPASAMADYHAWIGERVVFLPQLLSLREYGYQSYSYKPDRFYPAIPHDDLAGKEATVVDVRERTGILDVTLSLEDGRLIYGRCYGGCLDKVGFLSEMRDAKACIGKVVWNKSHRSLSTYDWNRGQFRDIPLRNLEPLTVMDVRWWYDTFRPFEFVMQTSDGRQGSWYGSYSRINDSGSGLVSLFEDAWFLTDPRLLRPDWPDVVWDAISNFEIAIGMTKEMVEMSWGRPKKVNRTITASGTHEQWVYGDGCYVYFENGQVTAIQD